jgi:transposase
MPEVTMREPLRLPELTPEAIGEFDTLYRTTRDVRLRARSQMVLLTAEQSLSAPAIARIMRVDDDTVLLWLKRYLAEGINGLADRPRPGGPTKVTPEYR